jgi:hypothetical protein
MAFAGISGRFSLTVPEVEGGRAASVEESLPARRVTGEVDYFQMGDDSGVIASWLESRISYSSVAKRGWLPIPPSR